MRILFLTCQPPHHMAPPRLGDEQIDCGPCFTNQQIAGRWITRTTPFGPYDVSVLAAELAAAGQTPDVVVCHVDCGFCLKPLHLDVFRCPKILLAADSHWGDHAISGLVNYASSEPFDRVVLLYDRHHAEFYRAAGIRNLHWFPGLTFSHPDLRVQSATEAASPRGAHLALVGKTGYHARRQRLFAALINARIPLAWRQLRQSEVIAHYAASLIGLNVAMNGDLNLRVFETIAGGALLLTDRLAPESGLDEILAEGREKISYDNAEDLVEKARHFLAHPDEARAIGAAGHRWFLENFSEARRRAAFRELVFDGRDHPAFTLPAPAAVRVTFGPSAAVACDVVNELHRHQETVVVRADDSVPAAFDALITVLPRTRVVRDSAAPADVSLSLSGDTFTALPLAPEKPAASPIQKLAAESRHHLDAGDVQGALEKAQKVLGTQPQNADALLVMAELAADVGNRPLYEKMLAGARRIAGPADPRPALLQWSVDHLPGPRQPVRLIASAWKAYESLDFASAEKYVTLAVAADPAIPEAGYIAGLVHSRLRAAASTDAERLNRFRLELAAFQRAAELAPDRPDYAFALAVRLREGGSVGGAISFYDRAVAGDPGLAAAWLGLGEAHLEQNNHPAAAAAFAEGLRHAPGHEVLSQSLAIATERTGTASRAFAERFFALQHGRPDCPHTSLNPQWQNWVDAQPGLACIRTIARETTAVPFAETIRLLISAGAAAVEATGQLSDHADLPAHTALMAYQPWFNLDTRRLVAKSFDRGTLLILIDDETPAATFPVEVTRENLRTLTHRDVSLWNVCTQRLALRLGSTPSDIDAGEPRHAAIIREVYAQAAALIDRTVAYCDFYRPGTILMAQGHDLLSAVLRHVAVLRGLRVVAIENIFHSGRLLWDDTSGIAVNRNLAKNHFWRYREFVGDEVAVRSVSAFLDSLPSLKTTEHQSPADRLPARVDDGVRTITYLAQVGVDSSVLFGLRGFTSQVDAIAALASYAARTRCRLLVKLHPKESPAYPDPDNWYRRLTARWLEAHPGFQSARAALGDLLLVDEDNRYNTCDLIRQADVCVTVNSQSGLEAALLDREVVLCGDAFYGQLGFTHEANDAPSLEFSLDRILRDGLRLNDGRAARAFFHIFTELYCVPKSLESVVRLLSARPGFRAVPTTHPDRVQPDLVYDVGMNNGDDTAYYLQLGRRVIAIEADPDLCDKARVRFEEAIADGRLTIVNMGVTAEPGTLDFWICENKREWNSFDRRIASRDGLPHHAIPVPCQTFAWIVRHHGIPTTLKIDIEGHDRLCIDGLADLPDLPLHLSVELGDIDAFTRQLEALGYTEFKCVSQYDFLPLQLPPSEEQLRHEHGDAHHTRRHGDWIFPEGSSGPTGPDTCGRWLSAEEARRVHRHYADLCRKGAESPFWYGKTYSFWVDLHARRDPSAQVHRISPETARLVPA